MRVAQLNTYHDRGGAGAASRRLHHGLISEGVDSVYVCADANVEMSPIAHSVVPSSGMKRVYWKAAKTIDIRLSSSLGPGDWRAGLFGIDPDLQRFDPSIVHLHWLQHGFVSLKRLSRFSPDLPVVWTLHDLWPLTDGGAFEDGGVARFRSKKERMRAKLDPYWIAPSSFIADRAIAMGVDQSRLTVLPNPVEMEVYSRKGPDSLRQRLSIPSSAKICVCSAIVESGSSAKGSDLLRELLTTWGDRSSPEELIFVVIGSWDTKIAGLSYVRQIAPIYDEEAMADVFADADFFLSTSRFESFGLMIVEAQASGLPVVAFDVAAIPEVTDSGVTGFLASPFSIDSLRAKISECLQRLESVVDLKESCRQFARERFCSRLVAKAHRRHYECILADQK